VAVCGDLGATRGREGIGAVEPTAQRLSASAVSSVAPTRRRQTPIRSRSSPLAPLALIGAEPANPVESAGSRLDGCCRRDVEELLRHACRASKMGSRSAAGTGSATHVVPQRTSVPRRTSVRRTLTARRQHIADGSRWRLNRTSGGSSGSRGRRRAQRRTRLRAVRSARVRARRRSSSARTGVNRVRRARWEPASAPETRRPG
jgi:hypothetical protein